MIDKKKQKLQDILSDLICVRRRCENCYLNKYRFEHTVTWCEQIPLGVLMDYAHELYLKKDKDLLISFGYKWDPEYYDVINMIKSGGVQYDS